MIDYYVQRVIFVERGMLHVNIFTVLDGTRFSEIKQRGAAVWQPSVGIIRH